MDYPWNSAPSIGERIEVSKGIFWFRLPLPMALDHVNVYVIDEGDSWTIIDTGFWSKKTQSIWSDIKEKWFSDKPIGKVIVTHHHPDHVGLAGWFQIEFKAELWMCRTAWLMARMLRLDYQKLPTKETINFWRKAGMDDLILNERATGKPFNFGDSVHEMPLGFRRIIDGEKIILGNRSWIVRVGNGHAPEHLTLWCEDEPIVIAGDQIISSISPNLGVYATEPEADPVQEWLTSCEAFLPFANDKQLVLPGHKLLFYGLPHSLKQLIEIHHSARTRVVAFLKEPRTAVDCFPVLFNRK
ncbi:MAG: MBL fold metallo-hydrolase, partial [Pseudomonadota bacterium]|nr:MBL fold metallo-hydrolase [Pseudomonadota bacterium]